MGPRDGERRRHAGGHEGQHDSAAGGQRRHPEPDRPVEAMPPDEALRQGGAADEAHDHEAEGEGVGQLVRP